MIRNVINIGNTKGAAYVKTTKLLFLVCVILISACSNKELTREKANSILEKQQEEQKVSDVRDGEFKSYYFNPTLSREYQILASNGYITINVTGYEQHRIILNEKIKPFIVGYAQPGAGGMAEPLQNYRIAKVLVLKKKVGKVTGIRNEQNSSTGCNAIAEFTYDYEITPVGNLIGASQPSASGSACFNRFDDGWRLTSIN